MVEERSEAFTVFVERLRETYQAIAGKIEELIEALNVPGNERALRPVVTKINRFLEQLEQRVASEEALARRNLPKNKLLPFLELCQKNLQEIMELEAYVALAERESSPALITKINALYREVAAVLKREQRFLKR